MKVIKGETIDLRLTTAEFSTLIGLHQELADRGLCPDAKIGDQRDLTELDKYLEFLPERPCRSVVGHLRDSNEVEMEGHSIDTKMFRILPDGTWRLEISGTEELIADIARQLCSGSHFVYKGSQRFGFDPPHRLWAQLERPIGGEGSP